MHRTHSIVTLVIPCSGLIQRCIIYFTRAKPDGQGSHDDGSWSILEWNWESGGIKSAALLSISL